MSDIELREKVREEVLLFTMGLLAAFYPAQMIVEELLHRAGELQRKMEARRD